MIDTEIFISSMGSVSPLGSDTDAIWKAYRDDKHYLSSVKVDNRKEWIAGLTESDQQQLDALRNEDSRYADLDKSVLLGIIAARKAVENAGWKAGDDFGINIGSSRGATQLFEQHYDHYRKEGRCATLASPTTTLGNLSSWIAQDLKTRGPEISHSITCSTALHALINGVAWLRSGMTSKFLVGGSEAALTGFTLAQMKALKIYADAAESHFPSRAGDPFKKRNGMVLGEGASVIAIETNPGKGKKLARIAGVGYATESLKHNISISAEADCFQRSMKMALGDLSPDKVDAVVMHAPGTIKGDLAEMAAIRKVFGDHHPALTTNKWKLGHTFGASGSLSLELGVLMLQNQEFIAVPFVSAKKNPEKLEYIMVNAVGFGGNAVSVLIGRD
ncbi:beta-ketoacyl synthase N-terminal-like domain-containing protein [Robertkochia aurantiaca]|uniref:beta-ketoacyl synthase N-terminal-like domain-containing protein n=1 Tax=Robertkochia aurantiaca TaxID=2873700 RepID=UPI001CCBD20B|nr:beta-ketoacyl synthase N-terminal-like domain-containing protein [Robertkochia sp. 3YJGBD-33]